MRALARSLREIVDRHEALRTTFALHEGKPVQVIAPTPPELLTLVDLTELPEGKREAYAQQLAREQTQHPFDLTRNPLIRVLLLRLSSEQHILILSIHHSVCDGWSLGLLLGELSTLYPIYRAGQPSSLPALPLQYADYTLWQSDILQDARLQRQLIYWRRHLEGAPVALNLPTDHPHPAVQSYRGDACFFDLSRSLSQEIQALSKRHATTLFMTLLAALQVLLFRYSGQTDIVIGTPVAGRSRRELEGLIGLFINTLALRTDLSGNPSFSALLERVREVCLQAYTHQDAPFEKVVEAVQSERSLSHHPLFQVMFQLQNAPTGALALEGLLSRSLPLERSGTKFDLTVEFTETPNGLHGVIEYNTDLFERATIERLIQHYQHLLEGIIRDANQRISSLPLLGEEELQRLLVTWNATSDKTLPTVCIHQLFEAQVLRHPDAIALTYKDQQLTFAEVDRRANQIAHMLQARGVLPEVCVGIYLARTPEMVMGMLGVLKAGGAYVPLDSAFPVERLAFILHQTRVALVLTQHHLRDRLPAHTAPVLCLDSDWPAIAREKSFAPTCAALSSNLAYVIYTSGSTGAPKGVQIEHRGLTNYLSWCLKAYAVAEGQGSLLHSSLASDLTVTTLFAPLLAGRSLVIVPEDQGLDALGEALCQSRDLSLVKLTPAHLLLLAEQLRTRDVSRSTHALVIGGEALLQEHLAFWRTHAPETRLINEYGPTETVVGCCVYELGFDEKECADARSVPIGRPIANTQLYLLDQQLQPVPIGVPGELLSGGIGVARGYLHQPELTAECFLPDQFSQEPGRRLYRTGDRARYQPDGTIEFLGRNDTQVKLRGYRVRAR